MGMIFQFSSQKIKALVIGLSASAILAGSFGLTSTAQARVHVKPKATGIGYAFTRHRAKRLAIRAWERAVRRAYGFRYANYYRARSRHIACDYIGRGRLQNFHSKRRHRRGVIGQLGNVNAPWTCTATARPVKRGHFPPPYPRPPHGGYKPMATGVGYGNTKAGARGLSIRAWTNAVRRKYGPAYARYDRARQKSIACDYIGDNRLQEFRSRRKRRGVIGQAGNVNAPWTCTAKGRPRY